VTGAADWRPSAAPATLPARAQLLGQIRAFFAEAGVLEVETPALSSAGATDPALASLTTRYLGPLAPHGAVLYLQTSPEAAMKRLLVAGSGPIYQICRAFRDGERGRLHNPEFTLLEWYRPGWDHRRLMGEVAALVRRAVGRDLPEERLTYAEVFDRSLGIDPHAAQREQLRALAIREGVPGAESIALDTRDAWLDLLLTHCIEPGLGRDGLCFLYDYPATQAALARVRPGDPPVSERFELYWQGVELANGFHELADAAEQRHRFAQDNARRRAAGLPEVAVDERLLAALSSGLPECAGVALGIDRLLMLALGAERIDDVLAFPLGRI
jgi:lysyl-tRNA synthetase class 2